MSKGPWYNMPSLLFIPFNFRPNCFNIIQFNQYETIQNSPIGTVVNYSS